MDRSKSKMINYGIVYGLSDYGLADRLNIPREEAKAFIDAYLERFPRVAEFIRTTIESAREQGHVTTLFGRRRQIPELRARNWQVRSLGERLAVNTVIQGTAADIMKLAMIRVHRALAESAMTTRMILTIHDELLFEGPPEEADAVKELVEREMIAPWGDRTPPLAVDAGVGPDLARGEVAPGGRSGQAEGADERLELVGGAGQLGRRRGDLLRRGRRLLGGGGDLVGRRPRSARPPRRRSRCRCGRGRCRRPPRRWPRRSGPRARPSRRRRRRCARRTRGRPRRP